MAFDLPTLHAILELGRRLRNAPVPPPGQIARELLTLDAPADLVKTQAQSPSVGDWHESSEVIAAEGLAPIVVDEEPGPASDEAGPVPAAPNPEELDVATPVAEPSEPRLEPIQIGLASTTVGVCVVCAEDDKELVPFRGGHVCRACATLLRGH